MTLISFEQARDHLQLTADLAPEVVEDLMTKMDQASALVLDRINTTEQWRTTSATWTELTVPRAVQTAMLLVLTHLYEHRGDDQSSDEALWRSVNNLISLHRDPVIA